MWENFRDPGPTHVDVDYWHLIIWLDHNLLVQLVENLDDAVQHPIGRLQTIPDNSRNSLWRMVNSELPDGGDKNLESWGLTNARKTDHQISRNHMLETEDGIQAE